MSLECPTDSTEVQRDLFFVARFWREAKPRAFPNPGVSHFCGKGPDGVADPFGTVPRRCS